MRSIITLLTDFGLDEPYVGVMKGVILGRSPSASLVDLTHNIPPQDVMRAAIYLYDSFRYFPDGSVHLCVVDPGVGSQRQILVAEADGHYFVAPDNGLLDLVLQDAEKVKVFWADSVAAYLAEISATFHGRDIMAPLAAALAGGESPESLGKPAGKWENLLLPAVEICDGVVSGKVLYADRFGNLVTNLTATKFAETTIKMKTARIDFRGHVFHEIKTTYADAKKGELIALFNSSGRLEFAANGGSAAGLLTADEAKFTITNG